MKSGKRNTGRCHLEKHYPHQFCALRHGESVNFFTPLPIDIPGVDEDYKKAVKNSKCVRKSVYFSLYEEQVGLSY